MKRTEMLNNCPEEFEDELSSILDNIESRVNEALSLLEIKSLSEVFNLVEAQDKLTSLSEDLY